MSSKTFDIVPEKADIVQIEEFILKYWDDTNAFSKSLELSKNKKNYTFYDGPPFATGLPHYGHILAGAIKDTITRFQSQRGCYVPRNFGWDCHGLPVEYEIDKMLEIKTRNQIVNDIGIGVYNEKCREIVLKYRNEWEHTVKRMGRWIDFENDYKTMDIKFMESVWWVFKELYSKGLVYRDFKVMPYSTGCKTPLSNFEASLNYQEVTGPSLTVSFKVVESNSSNYIKLSNILKKDNLLLSETEFLAWTTTPWTLLANIALVFNPDLNYCLVELNNEKFVNRKFWIAEDLLQSFLNNIKNKVNASELLAGSKNFIQAKILAKKIQGNELTDIHYLPPFDFYYKLEYWKNRCFKTLADKYVQCTAGTGIVHNSPAFGEDDYRVAVSNNLLTKGEELPCHVDDEGYISLDGMFYGKFYLDIEYDVKKVLKSNNLLIISDQIKHNIPYCWRSDKPLMYKAVASWFLDVISIKEKLLDINSQTNWVPTFIQTKRFQNWLQDARDWCISRNRFWGTPIPVWTNEDYSIIKVIGSVEELQKYSDRPIVDLHKHYIDDITIPHPGGSTYPNLTRITEVFDCWFESGSMPYARIHYPFENAIEFTNTFPADFIGEGLDQTRGWFYTLTVIGAALFNKSPFKNVIVNGLVLANDGKKMSKRLKNYIKPMDLFNENGADAVRIFLLNSPALRAEPLKFCQSGVVEVIKNILLPWYHSYRFLTLEITRFENQYNKKWKPMNYNDMSSQLSNFDRWIISCTESLKQYFIQEMENYRIYNACSKLITFINNLTNWYLRMNRSRLRGNNDTIQSYVCQSIVYRIVLDLCIITASFMPFMSEYIYLGLKKALDQDSQLNQISVHHVYLDDANASMIDIELEKDMSIIQQIIIAGRLIRDRKRVPIKKCAKKITFQFTNNEALEKFKCYQSYIGNELNALETDFRITNMNVDLIAKPNFKQLGSRLGNLMKDAAITIKQLDKQKLQEYLSNNKLTIQVLNEAIELYENDIEILYNVESINENENIGVSCSELGILIIDFSDTEETLLLYTIRDFVTKLQKIRKLAGLNVNDIIHTYITVTDEIVNNRIKDIKNKIEESLRNTFTLISSDDELPKNIAPIHTETIEVLESSVRVSFVKIN